MKCNYLLGQRYYLLFLALLICSCHVKNNQNRQEKDGEVEYQKGTFGYDHNFLNRYAKVILLSNKDSDARILVSPTLQGRILTSTFAGPKGISLGYFNHKRVASNKIQPHTQAYGGEDRFWIGPQGGQYTIFFHPGDPFDFDHWFTPKAIDREPFEVISSNDSSVTFKKKIKVKNYSGFQFNLKIKRSVKLINREGASQYLGLSKLDDEIKYVGFESDNTLINTGEKSWKKETGLLSIWILGQFPAGATIVIPYKGEDGQKVYDEYFGGLTPKLTPQQIKTDQNVIYYKGSGDEIGKIGLRSQNATPFLGSYNSKTNVLTIIQYEYSKGETDYINSQWKLQKHPYDGDVINAYNDGPLDTTEKYTPAFYELESSSPVRELKPGDSLTHYHRTYHFQGNKTQLNEICKALLGTTIETIEEQFPQK